MAKRGSAVADTLSFVDLVTTNASDACDFYSALLGWEYLLNETSGGSLIEFELVGALIGILTGGAVTPLWTAHYQVANVDAAFDRVIRYGGDPELPPVDVADLGRMATARDPLGALFGLWQFRKATRALPAIGPGAPCLMELRSPRPDLSAAFYRKLVGSRPRTTIEPSFGARTAFTVDSDAGDPPGWRVHFAVNDLDHATRRVTELGGRTVRVAAGDSPRTALVEDPQGGAFGLVEIGAGSPAAHSRRT